MNGNTSEQYNSDLSLVKALDLEDNVLEGFYIKSGSGKSFLSPQKMTGFVEINPYAICRNSGIKDKNGNYVFEYDLLKLTSGFKNTRYGFLVWDEFYCSWKIRSRTDRTSYSNIEDWTIETVGNIILHDSDAEIIYKQEREDDNSQSFIDRSYCPSKFKK